MGIFAEMDMMQRNGDDPFSVDTEQPAFGEPKTMCDTQSAFAPDVAPETEPEPTPAMPEISAAPVAEKAEDQASKDDDEEAKRLAHEEAEAKRKAEFEARQKAKKDAEQAQLARIASMTEQELMAESMKRISTDTERLTRRNMKECISEHIQTLCLSDRAFAERVMHPRKTMIHCIWYINRKAQEFVEQEMKDNGIKPDRNGIYGCDVPDDLCYQWAEDYFNDPNAKEDQEEEEKFVPKPYVGKSKTPSKTAAKGKGKKDAAKPTAEKKPVDKKPEQPKTADVGQMTLGDFGMLGASA